MVLCVCLVRAHNDPVLLEAFIAYFHFSFGMHETLSFFDICMIFNSIGSIFTRFSHNLKHTRTNNTQNKISVRWNVFLFSRFTDDYTAVWNHVEWVNDDDDVDAMWTVDRRWAHLDDSVRLAVFQLKFPS